jgi:hypothetical protein
LEAFQLENGMAFIDDYSTINNPSEFQNFNFGRKRIIMKDYLKEKMESED